MQFEGVRYFWVELCIFSKLISANSQQLFCVTDSNIRQGRSIHTPPLSELLVSSVWLSFGEVWKTLAEECTKNFGDKFHYRDTSSSFFWIIFPALIDNPNNLEINRLITLVVSGIILLPYAVSLMSFSSFYSHFLENPL